MRIASVLVVLALTAHATPQQPRTLEVRGKLGDSYAYRLTSTIEAIGSEGKLDLSMAFTERLSKLTPSQLEWTTTFTNVVATGSGVFQGAERGMRDMNNMTVVSIQDRRGKVLRLRVGTTEMASQGSSNVVLPPNGNAKVGTTWAAPIETGGQVFTITYRLAAYENFGARRVARIEGRYGRDQKARAIQPTVFWVDAATGKMMRSSGQTEVEMGSQKVRVTFRIERA